MTLTSRRHLVRDTCLTVVVLPAVFLIALTAWQINSTSNRQTLFTAIRNDDSVRVAALLEAGADPNAHDPETARGLSKADHFFAALNHDNSRENGQTPLLAALCRIRTDELRHQVYLNYNPSPNPAIIRLLLEKGAKVETSDSADMSPIAFAVLSGNTEVVALLHQHGAKVNKSGGMEVPLIIASSTGQTDMIRFLLARGADITAENATGTTALIAAVRYAHQSDVVQMLLDAGADVNHKDKSGNTALHYARTPPRALSPLQTKCLPQVIKLLQNAGAK